MENIPKHCINIFIDKFKSYPSVIEFNPNKTKESINKFLGKSELVWINEFITDDGKKNTIETIRSSDWLYSCFTIIGCCT